MSEEPQAKWAAPQAPYMQQHPDALPAWERFIKENKIASVLELGTARGGFTKFLAELGPKVVTIDNRPGTAAFIHPAVEYLVLDCWTPMGRAEIHKRIACMPRPFVLICDNGNKIREVNDFGPLLSSGDFLATHDYAETKEYFKAHIYGKIWSWHEIWDAEIQKTLDQGFRDVSMKDTFAKCVWGVWQLVETKQCTEVRHRTNLREKTRPLGLKPSRGSLLPLWHEKQAIHESQEIPYRATKALVDHIAAKHPRKILAFGTARHTPVLARYLDTDIAIHHGAQVTVIEEDIAWLAGHRRALSEVCNLTKLDYRICPMLGSSLDLKGQVFDGPYDLVVMNGPKDIRACADNNILTLLREQTTPQTTFFINHAESPHVNAVREAVLTEHGNWSFRQEIIHHESKLRFNETCVILHAEKRAIENKCDICISSWNNHPDRLRGLELTLKAIRLNWLGAKPNIWISQESRDVTPEQLQATRDLGATYGAVVMDNPAENTWVQNLQNSWSRAKTPYILFMEDDWIICSLFDVDEVLEIMGQKSIDITFMRMWHTHSYAEVNRGSEFFGECFRRNEPDIMLNFTLNPWIRRHPMEEFQIGDGKGIYNGVHSVQGSNDAEAIYCQIVGSLIKEGKVRSAAYNASHFVAHYNMEEAKTFRKTTDGTRR